METKTITTEDLKTILNALDAAYEFVENSSYDKHEHPICKMIEDATEAVYYVSL